MSANHDALAKCYFFKVGKVDCTLLLDGLSPVSNERMMKRFPHGTEAAYRQAYADIGLSFDDADSSLNILLLKMGDETILIDAGEGGKPNGGHVLASMQMAGIDPSEITLVVITHAHGDHVQGSLIDDQTPAYPNATYVMSKQERAFWEQRIEAGTANHRPIVEMMEANGLRLIEMDEPIIPGMTAVPIPGHTPGMIAVLIESEGEKLIHVADMLHSPMQFAHPEWSPSFDADTTQSVVSRREILGRAADENMRMLFFHLTFPGLGQVKRAATGDHFVWEGLKVQD